MASEPEILQCLTLLKVTYRSSFSNMTVQEGKAMAHIWTELFADTPIEELKYAVSYYISYNNSGFAPTIGQLNHIIQNRYHPMTPELEAWTMVKKAIGRCDDLNAAKAEWSKFPEDVRRTIQPADLIRIGRMDSSIVETSVAMMFRHSLAQNQEIIRAKAALPGSAAKLLEEKKNDQV